MHLLFDLIASMIGAVIGESFAKGDAQRRWKRAAARGRYMSGLRLRSGIQRGTGCRDWREGEWEITPGRMKLEELDLRDVEIVPNTLSVVAECGEGYLLGEADTRSLVIRTEKAEFDWLIPASIAPQAIRSLRGPEVEGEGVPNLGRTSEERGIR